MKTVKVVIILVDNPPDLQAINHNETITVSAAA